MSLLAEEVRSLVPQLWFISRTRQQFAPLGLGGSDLQADDWVPSPYVFSSDRDPHISPKRLL